MSEQNINTLAQFEDSVNKILTGDTQKNALNFVRHLDSLGMAAGGNSNDGRIIYKGKKVCDFHLSGDYTGYPGPWTIWMTNDYGKEIENVPIADRMKEIAWANVHYCENCGGTWCSHDKYKTIFGRDFDNACHSPIAFTDPDAEAVECAKKLMEMQKHAIDITTP